MSNKYKKLINKSVESFEYEGEVYYLNRPQSKHKILMIKPSQENDQEKIFKVMMDIAFELLCNKEGESDFSKTTSGDRQTFDALPIEFHTACTSKLVELMGGNVEEAENFSS